MSKNINQVYIANPLSTLAPTDLIYVGAGAVDGAIQFGHLPVPPYSIKKVNDTDYVVLTTDCYVGYTALTANRTVTLPNPNLVPGRLFIIKNETTATFPVEIIVTAAAGQVNGAASRNLNLSHSGAQFLSDGANYWIIAVTSQFVN